MTSTVDAALLDELKARAQALGFDAFGITSPTARPDLRDKLDDAVRRGWHGDMTWMAETADRRADPLALWNDTRSIIMLGVNYGPDRDPLEVLSERDWGSISVYARNRDYHDVIKGRLKELAGLLSRRSGADVKVFVDTAPVMEKPLAEAAGLGWQGKHTVLVSRDFGSWLFLGAIFTSAELPADAPHPESCGSCRRCLDVCPTAAFPAPFQLDARRCLAYLNIEHKGPIPHEFRVAMGNRIYGCDDCLAVCPWNKFATASREFRLAARDELNAPALAELADLDDAGFRALFAGSPIKRIGRGRFLRNVLIAIGNSGDTQLLPQARRRLEDDDALVRGAAVWAVRRLTPPSELRVLALDFLAREGDTTVRSEWTAELLEPMGVFFFGMGYSSLASARAIHEAIAPDVPIAGTTRTEEGVERLAESPYRMHVFDGVHPGTTLAPDLRAATHVVLSIPPNDEGDPAYNLHRSDLDAAENLEWICYYSTVGVYGDFGGAWVDETAPTRPINRRSQQRVEVEQLWRDYATKRNLPLCVLRLAGIYGPGRSSFDKLREGTARRIVKPGQVFNRIHVDDIGRVTALAAKRRLAGTFNLSDDEPAPPQDLVEYAARLLGVSVPAGIPFEEAEMTPMARSFYSDNKRVSSQAIKSALGIELLYPTYQAGLDAIYRLPA